MKELEALEEWRDIVGYEGLYQVSNFGNVKSLPRLAKNKHGFRSVDGCVLKKHKNSKGYITVVLTKNSKSKYYFLHRLIATSFIPNVENKPFINHKDCNQLNNSIDNLEWCTQKENVHHAIKNGRYENVFRVARLKKPSHNLHLRKNIIQKDLNGEIIREWNGVMNACRELKIDSGNITKALNGKNKTCGGFIWEYASSPSSVASTKTR